MSCCIAGVGWAPSTVVKSKGGLALCWIPNSVLAIGCKYVLGVRSRQEYFSMLIYVCRFYVCNAGCTSW